MKQEAIFGWHFVGDTLRDGSPIPKDGVWLPKIAPIKICLRGYHGSLHPLDALQYAPGDTLCYCEYRGQIIYESDKFVAEQRRIVTRMDATERLRYFARMQALSVADLWEPPDVVLDWLMTGDESLQAAARDAAWSAWAAARGRRSDARDAAGDACDARDARAARCDAAWSAWSGAAWSAWASARAAAWSAVGAARAAARDARAAARDDFAALVYECFGIEWPCDTWLARRLRELKEGVKRGEE